MIQKYVIEVETQKTLSEYGDGHVLLYNKDSNRYYLTTRESLLFPQNQKIKKLEKEIEDFEDKELKAFKEFTEQSLAREKKFLEEYQKTNACLINMVKKLIVEE